MVGEKRGGVGMWGKGDDQGVVVGVKDGRRESQRGEGERVRGDEKGFVVGGRDTRRRG